MLLTTDHWLLTTDHWPLTTALKRHDSHFLLHLNRIHHYDRIPGAAIEETAIWTFADTLFAADAENWVNLNASKRWMVFIRHPEHAVFHRAIFDTGGRAGAARAALGDYG